MLARAHFNRERSRAGTRGARVQLQSGPSGRDSRVDLLRGIALLFIFIDHVPGNILAAFTLHAFGFSDAAELFVILAGFSATIAYTSTFESGGLRVGLAKVFRRCLKIYGAQVGLLLTTLLVVAMWTYVDGEKDLVVEPLLRDGFRGTMRGVALFALPAFLDILPLYIVLLAAFPLVRYGLSRSIAATFAVSLSIYAAANAGHANLPNVLDPEIAAYWSFNPLAWQLIFVCGAALALGARRKFPLMVGPPLALVALCWGYLAFAFVAQDGWQLWLRPFGPGFPGDAPIYAIFGNEPKTFVTPWRLLHVLAIAYLALTSGVFARIARSRVVSPILACGRHSLAVFALGCILALVGRLIFRSFGVTPATQLLVNVVGIAAMIGLALLLARTKSRERMLKTSRRVIEAEQTEAGQCSGGWDAAPSA